METMERTRSIIEGVGFLSLILCIKSAYARSITAILIFSLVFILTVVIIASYKLTQHKKEMQYSK